MKRKQGISLIVLVITIIVMIILAASVVLTLSNSGIINKANEAVEKTNIKEVEQLASLTWAEEFMDGKRGETLKSTVLEKLKDYTDKYTIEVSDAGVSVVDKNSVSTLGAMVTSALDYGKTVDYEANGITDWKVFYHTEDYVYLIASENVEYDKIPNNSSRITVAYSDVTLENQTTKKIGHIYWATDGIMPETQHDIQHPAMWMANWSNYAENPNGRGASYLLDETCWLDFKNTTAKYKDYVIGAIGTPTLEMFVASWNAKKQATNNNQKYDKELILNSELSTVGYFINDMAKISIMTDDTLYIWSKENGTSTWLASPSGYYLYNLMVASSSGEIYDLGYGDKKTIGIRPVVCMSVNTPVTVGATTDIKLVK